MGPPRPGGNCILESRQRAHAMSALALIGFGRWLDRTNEQRMIFARRGATIRPGTAALRRTRGTWASSLRWQNPRRRGEGKQTERPPHGRQTLRCRCGRHRRKSGAPVGALYEAAGAMSRRTRARTQAAQAREGGWDLSSCRTASMPSYNALYDPNMRYGEERWGRAAARAHVLEGWCGGGSNIGTRRANPGRHRTAHHRHYFENTTIQSHLYKTGQVRGRASPSSA